MKSEKQILENLKQEGEAFKIQVSDGLWDAIENEIVADAGKKRGAILGWISIAVGGSALIAAYVLMFLTPLTNDDNEFALKMRFSESSSSITQVIKDNSIAIEEKGQQLRESNFSSTNETSAKKTFYIAEKYHSEGIKVKVQPETPYGQVFESNEKSRDVNNLLANENQSDIDGQTDALLVSEEDNFGSDKLDAELEDGLLEEEELDSNKVDAIDVSDAPIIKEPKLKRFGIILTGGLGSSYRTLNSDVFHSLVTHKDDHESFGKAFKLGIQLEWRLSERFFLRSGMLYSRYSEHYEFHHDVINHATDNDYNYIQVPVVAGFRLANFKRSEISILTGITWNFLHSAQSSWVDPALLTPVLHSNADDVTPFRGATMGLSLAFEYKWSINEKFNIHLSPGVDGFAHSVYKRNTELVQRPFSFNGSLGLSYSF